jgi:hypothetical protein
VIGTAAESQKSRVGSRLEESQRVKKQGNPAGCDVGRRKSGWLMVAKLMQRMLLSTRREERRRRRSRSTQHLVEPLPSLNPRNRGKRGIAYKVPLLLLIMSLHNQAAK